MRRSYSHTYLAFVSMDGGCADPHSGEHHLEEVDCALRLGKDDGLVARPAHVILVKEVDQLVQLK